MWTRIDRYVFRELFIPFGLALMALMMILLTQQLLRLAELFISKGVSIATVGKIFAHLLPAFLVIALPISVLIATIIAFSRLTADNEITALKASGMNLFRLSRPVHLLTLGVFTLTLFLSVWAQPWINQSLKSLAQEVIQQEFSLGMQTGVFNKPFSHMMIYIDEMPEPGHLKGIIIYDSRESSQPVLTVAEEGLILDDPASDLIGFRLLRGSQHREDVESDRYQWINFDRYEFKINLAAAIPRGTELPGGSSRIRDLKKRLAKSETLTQTDLSALQEHYQTTAFPFSSLIFGLIGIPLGLVMKRGGQMGGLALGISIALLYYILMIVADFLASSGRLHPIISAWFPNAVTGMLALGLIFNLNRK